MSFYIYIYIYFAARYIENALTGDFMNAFWVEAARCRSSEMRRRRRRCLMKNYKVCMSHRYPRRWCRAYLYSITLIAGGFVYTIFFCMCMQLLVVYYFRCTLVYCGCSKANTMARL